MNQPQPTPERMSFARHIGIAVGIITLTALLIWVMVSSVDILLLLLAAILIALPLRAGANWLSQKTRWPAGLCLGLVGSIGLGILVGVGVGVVPLVSQQAQSLQNELPSVLQNARKQLAQTAWGEILVDHIPDSPETIMQEGHGGRRIARQALGAVSATFGVVTDFYIVFFLALFLAAQPTLYVDGFVNLLPLNNRQRARHILATLNKSLLGWLGGTLVSMAIVGLLSGLGLWLLNVRLAGILALFAGLITFIPNLGPILALIPALLFALLDGPQQALYVLSLYVGIQTVESNIITPIIQKRLNNIPPALLLLVQLIVGAFAGTLGLALAAPILVILMGLVKMVYQENILGDTRVP